MMTGPEPLTREEIEALLRFYAEAGMDFPVLAEPENAFSKPADMSANGAARPAAAPLAAPAITQARPARGNEAPSGNAPLGGDGEALEPTLPDATRMEEAARLAQSADSLDALADAVARFDGCNLKRSARSLIFEGGQRGASVMLVAGAPSRDDDTNGEAWSGADGLFLEQMLQAIGLSRETVYCGFCVPWHPPGGMAPSPLNLSLCKPFIDRQIELAAPEILVAVGNVAMRAFTGQRGSILSQRGRWRENGPGGASLTAIIDPALLREQPALKRETWLDLLAIRRKLGA